jgi:hypothetical protein
MAGGESGGELYFSNSIFFTCPNRLLGSEVLTASIR